MTQQITHWGHGSWMAGIALLQMIPACHTGTLATSTKHEANSAVAALSSPPTSIVVSPAFPSELNGSSGGAPRATPEQAAAFSWQEFIALNWPATQQDGALGNRDSPSSSCLFGDPKCTGPTTWETFRSKVETFPGTGNPPGYTDDATQAYGYDALPQYNYIAPVGACDSAQAQDVVPWVNLDETDEITLASMYAGVVGGSSSPGNSSPQLIRFLAKSNRAQYVYVTSSSNPNSNPKQLWWSAIPLGVMTSTKDYLAKYRQSPPAGSKTMVSQPYGTVEVKAGWRPLNPPELASGRFHTQMVRFYEERSDSSLCYRDAIWGLIALHIIQKTPSAPYFIYATFEQADNLLSASGSPVENADGELVQPPPATATTPQVCLNDPRPPSGPMSETTSSLGSVALVQSTTNCQPVETQTYCNVPGNQLYYRNTAVTPPTPNSAPSAGNICVNRRANAIPGEVIAANVQAHAAISAYLNRNQVKGASWLFYKLVNVQYFPYDHVITAAAPNGSLYDGQPPYSASHPSPSSYYQANIVVETNRSLQLFSGGLSPNISTNWNLGGSEHQNTYYAGGHFNMGGCMGCHGSQGQNPAGQAGDFSVILARGSVPFPEPPAAPATAGLSHVRRNRTLTR